MAALPDALWIQILGHARHEAGAFFVCRRWTAFLRSAAIREKGEARWRERFADAAVRVALATGDWGVLGLASAAGRRRWPRHVPRRLADPPAADELAEYQHSEGRVASEGWERLGAVHDILVGGGELHVVRLAACVAKGHATRLAHRCAPEALPVASAVPLGMRRKLVLRCVEVFEPDGEASEMAGALELALPPTAAAVAGSESLELAMRLAGAGAPAAAVSGPVFGWPSWVVELGAEADDSQSWFGVAAGAPETSAQARQYVEAFGARRRRVEAARGGRARAAAAADEAAGEWRALLSARAGASSGEAAASSADEWRARKGVCDGASFHEAAKLLLASGPESDEGPD